MERKSREMLLVGIALAVMAGLFVWPATRWLIRLHLAAQVLPSGQDYAAAEKRVAEENPHDFQIQYARALMSAVKAQPKDAAPTVALPYASSGGGGDAQLASIRGLEPQFPGEPALYAHALRYATRGQVLLHRREQDELSLSPPQYKPGTPIRTATPDALAAFDRDADSGECVDINNAYFPLMRAVGLFEAGRDAEAIAAVHRAGQKTRYEDYSGEEFVSLDRYYTLARGERGALVRVAQAAALLFPQYTQLRAVCRMGVVSAVHAEQRGDSEAGFTIRHDLARAGALMREQGHTLICNLVGIAITSITIQRPSGEPLVKVDVSANLTAAGREQQQREKEARYYSYLIAINHGGAARWMAAELSAGREAKSICSKAGAADVGPFSMTNLRNLCLWWAASLLTLTNAMGLLILGAFAALAAQVSPGKRLLLWRCAFTCLVIVVFGAWLWNVERSIYEWATSPLQMTQLMSDAGDNSMQSNSMEAAAHVIAAAFALIMPLGMLLVLGIVSLCTRVPLATGIGRGLRGLALPIACTLFLIYAGVLMGTLRQERRVNADMQTVTQSEGVAMANALGKTWPGPTP